MHWATTGGSSIYWAKSGVPLYQAFRIMLFPFGPGTAAGVTKPMETILWPLDTIATWQWHVNWCARRA